MIRATPAASLARSSSNASFGSSSSFSLRRRRSEHHGTNNTLEGVVACLTGFSVARKEALHALIERLGGRFTRDLDTCRNTHLLSEHCEGLKYETACRSPRIHIVTPSWLEECERTHTKRPEHQHSLHPRHQEDETDEADPILRLSLLDATTRILSDASSDTAVFAPCRCLLVGFDSEDDQLLLGKLLRRGMGTVYWTMNEMISHLIVSSDCDQAVRDACKYVCLHHPNGPIAVSHSWVLASLHRKCHQPPHMFPPKARPAVKLTSPRKAHKKTHNPITSEAATSTLTSTGTTAAPTGLFRGALVTCMKLASFPPGAVMVEKEPLERAIVREGGHVLTRSILEALQKDAVNGRQRTCYVIALDGGNYQDRHPAMYPLLGEVIKNKLCHIVPVTPVWVQTCLAEKWLTSPNGHARLFEPQGWPLRKLITPPSKTSTNELQFKVAVTGFVGSERSGMIQVLTSLGATYTENMRRSNTHLICKEGGGTAGAKFTKAIEWGLHVVSVDWLYHVAQHGGTDSSGLGFENQFSLVPPSQRQTVVSSKRKNSIVPVEAKENEPNMEKRPMDVVSGVCLKKRRKIETGSESFTQETCNTDELSNGGVASDEHVRIEKALQSLVVPIGGTTGSIIDAKQRKRPRRSMPNSECEHSTEEELEHANITTATKEDNLMLPPFVRRKSYESTNKPRDDSHTPDESQVVWYGEPTQDPLG